MSSADWRAVVAEIGRTLTRRGRERSGRYAIEGLRLHERALRAGAALESVVVSRRMVREADGRTRELLDGLEAAGCGVYEVEDAVVRELTEGRGCGELVGLVRSSGSPTLESCLAGVEGARRSLLVAVDVEDPGNVGALVRTALACGAVAFVGVGISDPFHPRAVRTSMGSVFKLPILHCAEPLALMERLRSLDVSTVGAVTGADRVLDDEVFGERSWALFVGSEAFGLDGGAASRLERRVRIPMPRGVDSFSVNAAAAIVLNAIRHR